MAKTIPWLEFLSAEERKRRQDRMRRRLMPKGDEQRAAEVALLRAVIRSRADDTDLVFQLLQAKECLLPDDAAETPAEREADRQQALAEWLRSPLTRRFAREERAAFWALAAAECALPAFDAAALPSPEALRTEAAQLVQQHAELF